MQDDCVFCKLISHELPAKIIHENDTTLVVQDLYPRAPVHYLVMPKKHIVNLAELTDADASLVWDMIKVVRDMAQNLDEPKAFNLISNNGAAAGQSVFHLHWHFLSGKNLYKAGFSL
jgi:diadenosine tetraphosphate (Ap4A) HIT family hydrolase